MEDRPSEVLMFIELRTDRPLTDRAVRAWYKAVKSNVPNGVLGAVQVFRQGHELQSVLMVHREEGDRHHYIIPLNRHLLVSETQKSVEAWGSIYNEDFDVEASSTVTPACPIPAQDELDVEQSCYDSFCEQLAKYNHTTWLNERVNSGWRFGEKMSFKNRTHPMLKPWDELPSSYRKVDYELPNRLIEFLDQQGYMVVSKDDYKKFAKKNTYGPEDV